jgi:NOL1/NOP2/fmu family ribosome biogenesis protein
MNLLHLLSILLEVVVAALGIMLATSKKKIYGWCIALTFVLYVVYDLANLLVLNISQDTLYMIFFVATLSILWAVWNIFLEA